MDIDNLEQLFYDMWPHLDERNRRLFAAAESKRLGHGGITLISSICGLSRVTITKGIKELELEPIEKGRIRQPGSGRPTLLSINPEIEDILTQILQDTTRGDPESLLCWTLKSTRKLAEEIQRFGFPISHIKVGELLHEMGYSLQSNRKVEEGKQHEDRDKQFRYINSLCKKALEEEQPVLSVDTKKMELVGNFKNHGQQWRAKDDYQKVKVHDFPDSTTIKAIPYGIYDIGLNKGFVNVAINHDTATFAVNSIHGWWKHEGRYHYKNPKYLVVTADSGGSNGYRIKLWKFELQKLASNLGFPIKVSHFPPGTSKWNKVEHKLFSFISSNWKGQPLRDIETVVNLISHTYSNTGLTVQCRLDRRQYKTGRVVTNEEFNSINLSKNKFHGEWNYTILNI